MDLSVLLMFVFLFFYYGVALGFILLAIIMIAQHRILIKRNKDNK